MHRPDILDRNGRLLATDIKGATLYADPAKVIDRDELVEQVASVLPDIDTAELREKLKQGKRFVAIKRELTPQQQAEIYELGQPGLGFIEEYRRVYPVGATACHVVGYVNVDNKGLAGIEKFIDDNPQLAMSAPENAVGGEAVTLSLDLGVQHVVREELVNAMATYRAKAAAGVVIDVASGEVIAMVSLPDYDPNHREAGPRQGSPEPHDVRRLRAWLGVQGAHRGRRARCRQLYDALELRRQPPDSRRRLHHRRFPRQEAPPDGARRSSSIRRISARRRWRSISASTATAPSSKSLGC